ncbi:MAG: YdcH family protein [Proteobacteria bacterium]|nr:YdcH family protein [Pseudomonadota bacterium]
MTDQDMLEKQLAKLRREHRELDEKIQNLAANSPYDPIEVQRLKKRKLQLKDEIARLDSALLPDIIA